MLSEHWKVELDESFSFLVQRVNLDLGPEIHLCLGAKNADGLLSLQHEAMLITVLGNQLLQNTCVV